MPFRLYLFNSKILSLSKEQEKRNIFTEHFPNQNMQTGVEINPQKQLLAYAAVQVEKYMVKKLCSGCIQICAPFNCKPNRYSSTYEEMAKGCRF